jgi:hypothetical protein
LRTQVHRRFRDAFSASDRRETCIDADTSFTLPSRRCDDPIGEAIMRNIAAVTALALALALPGAALAVQYWTYDLVADCNGWTSNVEIWFREGYTDASISWTAVVTDAGGAEIERFTGGEAFPVGYTDFVTFTYGDVFAASPGEGWTMRVDYVLYDNFIDGHNAVPLTLTAAVICTDSGGGSEEPCCRTADWWRRHPETWPMTSLMVGGDEFDAAMLQRVLDRPAWGNLGMLLARQLVAARFNAETNSAAGMTEAINAADAYLGDIRIAGGGHAAPRGKPAWVRDPAAVLALITPLVEFNAMGCPSDPATGSETAGPTDLELVQKALAGTLLPEESVTFGTLKARYR